MNQVFCLSNVESNYDTNNKQSKRKPQNNYFYKKFKKVLFKLTFTRR